MEFFTLQRYQEELGKDFKRITLFLYTLTDFKMSEGGITADVQESEEQLWDMSCNLPDVCYIPDDPPKENEDCDKDVDIEEEHLEPVKLQIEDDFQIAQALQASLDNRLDNVVIIIMVNIYTGMSNLAKLV